MCVLPAAGEPDPPSQYKKKCEMIDRLKKLEKHWSEYIPQDSPAVSREEELSSNNTPVVETDLGHEQEEVEGSGSDDDIMQAAESLLNFQ